MTRLYDLGPFRLDAKVGALTRAGMPAALGARAVAVLTVLVEHAHQFVSKGGLIDAAWPDVIVEESNLAVQIHAIRRVLSEAPGGEHWVETLAKRGYRFVGPVTALPDPGRRDSTRSNLPEPVTSFVGRERDLVEIKRLLPTKRLVTLVGVGGIGKTRLALQIAGEVIDAYRDGVWFVELGSLRDPALVPTSLAQVLGVPERAGKPLTDALCAHLRKLQVLLILDNCEHLLGAGAQLVDALLRKAADTTVLTTSREPLRTAGEQVYPLQPLSLPESEANVETMARSDAVQLMVDRVRRQLPDFELTAARAPAVAELCIHLDGIPLALELAAARTRSLSVEQINARLGDRFRLLTGGARTALPRQQTLRATIDWSYDLLVEDERVVLRRLAIFAGSFTVEAASAVTSDAKIDEFAVIDLLSQLVARSLVVADTGAAGTRYWLLETMRAYALEKLAEVGEMDAIARRHAEHFRDLFERAPGDWLRMSNTQWNAIYLREVDHVRVALDWALAADAGSAIAVALAGASASLWLRLSLYGEGRQRLEAAVTRVGPNTSEFDEARLWLWSGLSAVSASPGRAIAAFERAVSLYRKLDYPLELGLANAWLAAALAIAGRFDQARAALAEAFPRIENCGIPKLLAFYHGSVAVLEMLSGNPASARTHFERALSLFREAGSDNNALDSISNLASVSWALGDLVAAETSLREYIAMRGKPYVRRSGLGGALGNLAGVLTERGQLTEALEAAREALPLLADAGDAWSLMDHLALRAALTGKHRDAALLAGYIDAAHAARQATRPPNEARARDRLRALLREMFLPEELERVLAEGAKMSDDEASRLALED